MNEACEKPENGVPAYRRIQRALASEIESGALKPGDPVPSERELARKHGVSLMTARHAVKELQLEGMVERRPGTGTYVAPPRIHFNKLVSFTEQMAARGFAAHSQLVSIREEEDPEIAARLALPAGDYVIKLERIRKADGTPFARELCCLPAARFSGLREAGLDHRSLFTVLDQEYGLQLAYADEEVDATAADNRLAELLHVNRGAPLLRIRQVLFNNKNEPIVYSLALYRSDRYSLLTRRFR